MYKVFIVEDEVVVREGLRDNIPWEQYGFAFAGEAGDGEIALPMIRQVKPDVLITDIRMPFMDGLSLCRVVKSEFPDILIVILSGYDDFEYARRAIEIGVEQYLTKPVTRRAMTKVLSALSKKLEAEKQREDSLFLYREEQHAYEKFKKRKFFEDVFAGRFTVEEIFRQAGRLGLDLTGPVYRVLLADVYEPGQRTESEALFRCREDVERFFLRHPYYLFTEWVNDTMCVIVKGGRDTVDQYTRKAAEALQELTGTYGEGLDYFLCISGLADRFSSLGECYAQASQYYTCRYLSVGEHIIHEDNYPAAAAARLHPGAEDTAGAGLQAEDGTEGDAGDSQGGSILTKALEFIDAHYTDENISLSMAAGAVQVSQGYFSALFSQKMGMTFIEYVTARRIEKAKQLLDGTKEHTAVVAAMTGYKDPNYFRFVFKKMTGYTPRDYRNRKG